MEIFPISSRLF